MTTEVKTVSSGWVAIVVLLLLLFALVYLAY